MPSERAIARSLAPQACFRRRISRTRRIDTLSAGIGSPTRHWSVTDRRPLTRPAVERPPPQGWPTSDRNGRHHVGIGGRLHLGISGRLAPESADYVPSERSKSEIYLEALPLLNAGRVELLDHSRLFAQLVALERRTARGGRDTVDHPPQVRDDVANAVCGAVVRAAVRPPVQIKSSDFIIGRRLESATMLGPMPDWRTAFDWYAHADW